MLLVGLTGNIASGKSTVAREFAARGAIIVDADVLARHAVRPGTEGLRQIANRWGMDVLHADGTLDRGALRARVFDDHAELEALNAIVHPEVHRLRKQQIDAARDGGAEIVVCDIPLLFEKHLTEEFDVVVLVDAPRPVRLERLVRDRGLHEAEAMKMIAAQMPAELKRARADFVIDNEGPVSEIRETVAAVWRALGVEQERAPLSAAAFLDHPQAPA